MKKIYIEITNSCNLNCSFCIKNSRPIKFMKIDEFKIILEKIKNYTNYIYFHILGEPLMHPDINKFIDLAVKNDFNVNITTNGYLIDRIKNKNIRQLNISLHSYDAKYNISMDNYLDNIFKKVDSLSDTYISYRFWVNNSDTLKILNKINDFYGTNITLDDLKEKRNIKIKEKIFINTFHEFIWPDLNNNYYNDTGKCYALKDHMGILSDGTIVPCCLDSKGIISLGNIFKDDLENILSSKRVKNMIDGFNCNKKVENLCKHCSFIEDKE